MRKFRKNNGFGLIGVIIVLAVIILAGGGGLYLARQNFDLKHGLGIVKFERFLNPGEFSEPEKELLEEHNIGIRTEEIDTSNWKTYRNEKYGFEFKYPLSFSFEIVKDYKGNDWSFKLRSPTKEILRIDREDDRFPEFNTFEEFAVGRSEAFCDADGPNESIYCTNENKKSAFTNPAGIVGYEIYLNETVAKYMTKQKTVSVKGPIFVLDFSPLNNPDIRGIFFNREANFSDKEIIVQIISTFKFIK